MGNCIAGQRGRALHERIHPPQDIDPPAGTLPRPSRAESGLGPPARTAQPTALDSLPDVPRLAIASFLQSSRDVHGKRQSPHGVVQDVIALALTSKAFLQTITKRPSDSDVLSKFRLLTRLRQTANECLNELSELDVRGAVHLKACGPMLGLFERAVRAEFVRQAIGAVDAYSRGIAIAGLSAGMVDLLPEHRKALVAATICNGIDPEGAPGMTVALAGLLERMDCLEADERRAIISATGNLIEAEGGRYRPLVIARLANAIRHLPPHQREALVEYALNEPNEVGRARALRGLGSAMAAEPSMNVDGRIVEAALSLGDDRDRADVIADLAVGMGSMEPALRGRFVTAALGLTDDILKTDVAHKLGAVTEHLSVLERADLVRLATIPGAIALTGLHAEAPELFMCTRVCGLAAGMAHLSPEQCDALSSTALGFDNPEDRAEAIGALGQGLQHLGSARREQLVASAIELGNVGPTKMIAAVTGLGAGANHLNDDQRNRLIDAVSAITGHRNVIARLGALSALTSAVTAMAPA